MNQQRARRFRSAQEASLAAQAAAERGEEVSEDRFDSNCITPGTEFMARLSKNLDFYIHKRMAEDSTWKNFQVILSGHEVPGEGEHKIMEYIRLQKMQPEFPPNTTHCLYGLDADLIMLGLVTHEPHFCLLREVVSFTGGARGRPTREVLAKPSEEGFILLHVGLLREYLELEFRSKEPAKFDLERVIDDFVFIAYLVGNDFLPTLPTLDIAEGALDSLLEIYKDMNKDSKSYLTHNGKIDIETLQQFFVRIGEMEHSTLKARAKDAQVLQDKKSRRRGSEMQLDLADVPNMLTSEDEGAVMMNSDARALLLDEETDAESAMNAWKERYYVQKAGLKSIQPQDIGSMTFHYVRGLHWVSEYYYRGVASWDWYYPFHYAPCASDLAWGVRAWSAAPSHMKSFTIGSPFSPFQQLLSVLPPASSRLLPEPFRKLMHEPSSPIQDFYPSEIAIDLEGKRNDWEGVILIPFIDQQRLVAASATVAPSSLSQFELMRNSVGAILAYSADESAPEVTVPSTAPRLMGAAKGRVKRMAFAPPPPLPPDMPGFTASLLKGTKTGTASPGGFPTLKTLPCTGSLKNARVNVFGNPSKKESLVLFLKDLSGLSVTAADVAPGVLGKRCFVQWPYLKEAQVVAVSDAGMHFDLKSPTQQRESSKDWAEVASSIKSKFLEQAGVDVGDVSVILYVKLCTGLMRNLDGTIEKRFSSTEEPQPLQAVLQKAPGKGKGSGAAAPTPIKPPKSGSRVLFLGSSYFGSLATVLPSVNGRGSGLRVAVDVYPGEPTAAGAAKRILANVHTPFLPSYQCAKRLKCSPRALGAITGSLRVKLDDGSVDVGLNLKNKAHRLYVPDFARPAPNKNGSEGTGDTGWQYSQAAMSILEHYRSMFPCVFAIAEQQSESATRKVSEVLPELEAAEAAGMLYGAQKWLMSQPLAKRPLVSMDAKQASEAAIRALEAATPSPIANPPTIELEGVAPSLLLPPVDPAEVALAIAGGMFDVGDRIVFLGLEKVGSPPFGARGAIVGVHEGVVEVLFDAPFSGADSLHGRCATQRGKVLHKESILNISRPIPSTQRKQAESSVADTSVQRRHATKARSGDGSAYASALGSKAAGSTQKAQDQNVRLPGPVLQQATAAPRKAPAQEAKGPGSGREAGKKILDLLQMPEDGEVSQSKSQGKAANGKPKAKESSKVNEKEKKVKMPAASDSGNVNPSDPSTGPLTGSQRDESGAAAEEEEMAALWRKLSNQHLQAKQEEKVATVQSTSHGKGGQSGRQRKGSRTKVTKPPMAGNGQASAKHEELNFWKSLENSSLDD